MKLFRNMQDRFFVITIVFFIIGMIHVSFSLIGLLCFTLPFYYYYRYKDKIWCKYICPRAGLFSQLFNKVGLNLKRPKFIVGKRLRKAVVIYFAVNLFFITMSTIAVTVGKIQPIEQVRFLIMFPWPFDLPQLLSFPVPPPLLHFSYRIYSMMFTSTIIGLILGFLYKPRTWCIICPINTLTSKDSNR